MPPPLSDLPFNAQPQNKTGGGIYGSVPPTNSSTTQVESDEESHLSDAERQVLNSEVRVILPGDKTIVRLIHRFIEFVINYGPEFEAQLTLREMNGPNSDKFKFLWDSTSVEHIYYRWKLYSILHGEHRKTGWQREPFRMFSTGPWWVPPPFPETDKKRVKLSQLKEQTGKTLSEAQAKELEKLLRKVTLEADRIADVMVFAIKNAHAVDEVMFKYQSIDMDIIYGSYIWILYMDIIYLNFIYFIFDFIFDFIVFFFLL